MIKKGEVFQFTHHHCTLAEGPLWLAKSKQLIFVDIHQKQLHLTNEQGDIEKTFEFIDLVGCVVLAGNDSVVVASGCTLYYLNLVSGEKKALLTVPGNSDRIRFNDGKVDPYGNLWIGTMDKLEQEPLGSLYRISPELKIDKVLEGITVSNGLDWDRNNHWMYFVDSPKQKVMRYTINFHTGALTNLEIIYTVQEANIFPDGLCIDKQGSIWLALWGGNSVININPNNGDINQQIEIPVNQVTSCAFGHDALTTLFITTAAVKNPLTNHLPQPEAGAIFCYTPSIGGYEPTIFNFTILEE